MGMISNVEKNISSFFLILLSLYYSSQVLIAAFFSITGTSLIDISRTFFISILFYYLISLIGCILAIKGIKKDEGWLVWLGIIIGIIPIMNTVYSFLRGYPYFQTLIISVLFIIPLITMFRTSRN